MARHRNADWQLHEGPSLPTSECQLAVLMDIRDELQALNRLLNCHNVRGGFEAMQRIDKRLKTKIKLR